MHNRTVEADAVVEAPDPWSHLPYEADIDAQAFIEQHPEGASLDQIAAAMGLPRSRVTNVMLTALAKLEHNRHARALAAEMS